MSSPIYKSIKISEPAYDIADEINKRGVPRSVTIEAALRHFSKRPRKVQDEEIEQVMRDRNAEPAAVGAS